MKKESGNIDAIVSSNGVKLHHFEPSKREIWTVVGKDNEHWLDPEINFCSCEDYFYNCLSSDGQCYHIKAVEVAKEQNMVEIIRFSDTEFELFISSLVDEIM